MRLSSHLLSLGSLCQKRYSESKRWSSLCCVALLALLTNAATIRAAEPSSEIGQWQSASGAAETTVYLADQLWTGMGDDPMNQAALVVRNGMIIEVTAQQDLKLQPGWKVESLAGSTLMPGMVIAETGLLAAGEEERTLSPEIRAIDGFDFFGKYDSLLASGITTVQISPGQNRLIPGQTAVVRLSGEDPIGRTIAEVESLRLQLTESAFRTPTIYEPPVAAVSVERPLEATRFQVAGDLPSALLTVRSLWNAARSDDALKDPTDELIIESIRPFAAQKDSTEQIIRVTARSINEVVAAIDLMAELKQPFILVAPSRIEPVLDRLADSKELRGVVLEHDLSPGVFTTLPDPESERTIAKPVSQQLAILRNRLSSEIPIALKPIRDGDLKDIRFLVSALASVDVTAAEALATVTGSAASLLGVQQQVGTLAVGRHADFVVLSGAPLDPETQVLETFVDGKQVHRSKSQADSILISGATVCSGDGTHTPASISVAGRSIRSVGQSISADVTGKTYSLAGCYITPGFTDAGTKLGAGKAITSRISMGDQLGKYLVADDDSVRRGRAGGVTVGLLASSTLPSPVVAFKLSDEPRVLKDPVALRLKVGGNPTTAESSLIKTLTGAKAYADSWIAYDKKLAEYKTALAKYEAEKKKYDAEVAKKRKEEEEAKKKAEAEKAKSGGAKKPEAKSTSTADKKKPDDSKSDAKPDAKPDAKSDSKPAEKSDEGEKKAAASSGPKAPTKPTAPKEPRKVSTLEPYRTVFKKQIPLIIDVSDESGVKTALEVVADKFGLKLVLHASGTAYLAADSIGKKKVPVIVGPVLITERNGRTYNLPQWFGSAGCPVLIQTSATTQAASLPQVVAHAASRGLGRSDAVQSLTTTAARVFNLPNIGEIKAGFDADLTVFDGPPFYPSSRVIGVMIDGKWAYLDSRFDPYASSEAGK